MQKPDDRKSLQHDQPDHGHCAPKTDEKPPRRPPHRMAEKGDRTASNSTVQRSRSELRPSIQLAYWLTSEPSSTPAEAKAKALDHRNGCPQRLARPTTTGKARTMEMTSSQPVQPNQRLNRRIATTTAAR